MNSSRSHGLLHSFKIWVRLARVPFLTATIIPVTLGSTVAWTLYRTFNPLYFVLTLAAASCLHLGTNIINDYFDFESGCDAINTEALSPISGGSRVLLENLVRPQSAYLMALGLFGVAGLVGVYLSLTVGWLVLLLGAVGIVSGYFYVTRLATHGIGELIVGLNFGPLVVLGSYYVQTQNLSTVPAIASVPVGLFITAILWINEIPDYSADKAVGKRTLVVRVGRKRGADLFAVIVIAGFLWTIAMVVLKQMPLASLVALIALPVALKAINTARKWFEKPQSLISANLSTINLNLLFGVLLVIGYALSGFFSFLA